MADEKKTVKVEIDYDSNAKELEQQIARLDNQTENLIGRVSQLREVAKKADSAQAGQLKAMADQLEKSYQQNKEIQEQLRKIEQQKKKAEADLKRIRNYTDAPVEFGEQTGKYGTHPYVSSKLFAGQRNPYARSKQNAYFKGDELISASTLMKMYSENRPRLNKTESVRKVIERLFKNFENPDSLVFKPTGENSDEEELLTELSYTMQKFQRAVFGAAKREKVNISGVAAPLSRGAQKFLTGNLFYQAGDFTSGQRKATSEAQDKELEKIARGYYATGQVYLDEEYEAQLLRRYEQEFAKDQIKNKSIAERAREIRSGGKIIPDAAKYGQEGKIASVRNLVRFLTEGEVAKSIPRYENRLSDENKGILKEMQQLYDFISNDKELSKFFSFDSGIEDPLKGTEVQEKLVSYLNTVWEKLIQYREENNNKMSQKVKKALDFKISDLSALLRSYDVEGGVASNDVARVFYNQLNEHIATWYDKEGNLVSRTQKYSSDAKRSFLSKEGIFAGGAFPVSSIPLSVMGSMPYFPAKGYDGENIEKTNLEWLQNLVERANNLREGISHEELTKGKASDEITELYETLLESLKAVFEDLTDEEKQAGKNILKEGGFSRLSNKSIKKDYDISEEDYLHNISNLKQEAMSDFTPLERVKEIKQELSDMETFVVKYNQNALEDAKEQEDMMAENTAFASRIRALLDDLPDQQTFTYQDFEDIRGDWAGFNLHDFQVFGQGAEAKYTTRESMEQKIVELLNNKYTPYTLNLENELNSALGEVNKRLYYDALIPYVEEYMSADSKGIKAAITKRVKTDLGADYAKVFKTDKNKILDYLTTKPLFNPNEVIEADFKDVTPDVPQTKVDEKDQIAVTDNSQKSDQEALLKSSALQEQVEETTEAIQKEKEELSDTKAIEEHSEAIKDAAEAEKAKIVVSGDLQQALNKESEAAAEAEENVSEAVQQNYPDEISFGKIDDLKFDDAKHQYSSNGEKFYSITQLRDLLLRGKNPAFGEDLNRIKEYANVHGSVTATDMGMSQKDFDFISKGVIGQGIKGDVFHSTIDKMVKAGATSLEELQQKDLSAFQSYQKERENAIKELQKYGLGEDFLALEQSVESYMSAMKKSGLTPTAFSEQRLGFQINGPKGQYKIGVTPDQLYSWGVGGQQGGAFVDNKTGHVSGYESLQLTAQYLATKANEADYKDLIGEVDLTDDAVKLYIADINDGVTNLIEYQMMSLEEFYSAIADAYSVAKGERSHYTKEEIAEKLNRQLKTGRIVSEAIPPETTGIDYNARHPSYKGFGGESYEKTLVGVLDDQDIQAKDFKGALRQYQKETDTLVKSFVEIYNTKERIKVLDDKMATLASSSNDADKNTLALLEKQKTIEEAKLKTQQEQYAVAQKAKEKTGVLAMAQAAQINEQAVHMVEQVDINAMSQAKSGLAMSTARADYQEEISQLRQAEQARKSYLKSLKEQQKIERDMLTLQNSMDDQVGPRSKEQQKLLEMYQSRLQAIKNQTVSYDSNTGKFSDGTQLSEQERLQFNKQIENSQAAQEEKLAKINLRQKESVGLIQQIANGFKASLRNLTDYSLAYTAIGYIKNSLQQVWQYTKDLDAAMVDLQIAAGMGYGDVKSMMYEFNNLAKEVGKSTHDVAVAANDWLRAGYQGKEASDLTKASMYLSTLGMIESADATSYLISVLKGWKIEASEVMSVVDRLTAVDMAAAASAGGIAEAMSRANNSAQLANTEMNRFIGYVTTMIDVTQKSEASIGESMKSLYARYQNVAAGKFVAAQEDIESENYNAEDWARLNDVETALGAMGIQLRDTVRTFRSFDDVLDEIASKWDTYSTVQQAGIATSLAGTRQRENLVAMLSNWDSVLKYQEIASNSYGTAVEKMEAYTNSIEAAQKRIQVATEKLTLNVNLQGLQKKLYNTIAEVIYNLDKFGLAVIAIAAIMNSNSLINVASNWYGKISDIVSSAGQLTYGIGRINTSEGREYLGKQLDEYKEYAEENFIVSQQKRYGAALSQATKGAQEVTQSYLLSAQSALLNESQDKQAAVAKELLTGTITEETVASLSRESLNALTMNVSEQRLAQMQHQIAVEQGMITQDQTLTAEQAKLVETRARQRLAAEELTQQEQKYKTALGKNLSKSSTQSYSQSLAAGTGAIVGGLLGKTAGGNIGKNFGEGGQLVGSMLGAMLIGQVGGNFGPRLSDSISKGISNYKASATINQNAWYESTIGKLNSGMSMSEALGWDYAKEGLTASEAFNREFAKSAKHSSKAFWSALASPQLAASAAVLFATIVYNAYVSSLKKATEKAQEEFKKATELYDSAQSASANAIKFDELANGVDYLGRNVSLTSEEYDKFLELSNDIAEVFPELVVRTDEFGNKLAGPEGIEGRVGKVTEAINDLTDSAEKAANIALFKNPDGISAALHKAFTGFSVSPFGVDLESTIEEYKKARTNEIKLQGKISGAEQTLSTMSPEDAGYEEQRKNISAWKDELETQQKQIDGLNQQLSDYNSQLISSADYIAEYAQYTGLSDRMSSLATDENNMVSALVQSSQATINRRLSQGTINEEGYKEQVLKVTDVMTKLLEEHPVIADVYYGTDDATLASEAVALKDSFKDALIEAFMSDGMISVEENELLLSLGLKYDAQSGKAVVLTLQEQIQEAVKGALGEDVTVSSSVNNLLNQLSSEDFGKVIKMANSGWIGSTTEDVDIIRMINADRTYDSEVGYYNRARQKQDSYDTLQERLKSYYNDVVRGKKEGSNEEIGKEFSDLPENVRNAVVASSKELKDFEGTVKEMQKAVQDAVYDTAWQQLASIQEDLAKVAEFKLSDAFGEIDGVEGVATTWAELKAVVDAVKDSYDTLSAAQKEQNAFGKLSTQTVISMLAENENYIELLDTSTGSLKLKANATQEMTRIQLEALKANMEAANAEDEMTKAQLEREWQELELSKTSGTATNEKIEANNNEIVSTNDLTKAYTELYASIQAVNMAKAGDIKGAEQMMKSKDALVEAAGKTEQTDATYKVDTTYIEARQKYIQDQMGEWDPDEGFANNGRLQQRIDARKIIMNDLQEMIDKGLDLGKDSTGFFTPDLSNLKDANEELEKFLSALEGIYNKEYYLMQAFKSIGEDINATSQDMYMGANYYGLNNGKDYDKLASVYERQMKLYAPLANEDTEEGLGYLQKYQEAYVKLKNLDDERVQDKINILKLQDASLDTLIAIQKEYIATFDILQERLEREQELNNLLEERRKLYRDTQEYERWIADYNISNLKGTAYSNPDLYDQQIGIKKSTIENQQASLIESIDAAKRRIASHLMQTEGLNAEEAYLKAAQSEEVRSLMKEYYELAKEYSEVIMESINAKVDEISKKIDNVDKERPKQWTSISQIEKSYDSEVDYINKQIDIYREALKDVSKLNDDQINELVDGLNEAVISLHEAKINRGESIKELQEKQYSAAIAQIDIYKQEIQDAIDAIETAYDKEYNKIKENNTERERAIKLEDLLAAKKKAAQEKEKVYREGIGWTWESNRSAQKEAQENLDSFYREDKLTDLEETKNADVKRLEQRISDWESYAKALEYKYGAHDREENQKLLMDLLGVDNMDDVRDKMTGDMTSYVTEAKKGLDNFTELSYDFKGTIEAIYKDYNTIFNDFLNDYKKNLEELQKLYEESLKMEDASGYLKGNDAIIAPYVTPSNAANEDLLAKMMANSEKWFDIQKEINSLDRNASNYKEMVAALQSEQKQLHSDNEGYAAVLDATMSKLYGNNWSNVGKGYTDVTVGGKTFATSALYVMGKDGTAYTPEEAAKELDRLSKAWWDAKEKGDEAAMKEIADKGNTLGTGLGGTRDENGVWHFDSVSKAGSSAKSATEVVNGQTYTMTSNSSGGKHWSTSSGGGESSGKGTYSSNDGKYTIGSKDGQNFHDNAKAGDTMTGRDGSTWTKNSDGSTTISKNGTTYTVDKGHADGILGGPITYTGLSMLHGTPSAPEYVLNADQAYTLLRNISTMQIPEYTSLLSNAGETQYILQGDVIIDGTENPENFWDAVTNQMRNRYSVTKNNKRA